MVQIVTLGHEALRRVAEPVKDIDDSIKALVADMFEAMRVGNGVGLAAPQVAKGLRLFITGAPDDEARVFINPEITGTSIEECGYEEGCLSIPGVYEDVRRPKALSIQAYNLRGRPFSMEAEGFLARIILHEMDHLNGVLFIDKLSEMKRERVLAQYEKRMRA
jgi:peptide deformylase